MQGTHKCRNEPHCYSDRDQIYSKQTRPSSSTAEHNEGKKPGRNLQMSLELALRKKIIHFKIMPSNIIIYLKSIKSPTYFQFEHMKKWKINKGTDIYIHRMCSHARELLGPTWSPTNHDRGTNQLIQVRQHEYEISSQSNHPNL